MLGHLLLRDDPHGGPLGGRGREPSVQVTVVGDALRLLRGGGLVGRGQAAVWESTKVTAGCQGRRGSAAGTSPPRLGGPWPPPAVSTWCPVLSPWHRRGARTNSLKQQEHPFNPVQPCWGLSAWMEGEGNSRGSLSFCSCRSSLSSVGQPSCRVPGVSSNEDTCQSHK